MDLTRYRHPPKLVAVAPTDPQDPAEDPDEDEDMEPLFNLGDDVQLRVPPRVPGQSTGDVREVVLTYAYGILFDGMEDQGIYHWYLESELAPGSDPPGETQDTQPNNRLRSQRTPSAPLSLFERRVKNNERRSIQ
jgi:hypothetical protein